jgi:hypothetical protein
LHSLSDRDVECLADWVLRLFVVVQGPLLKNMIKITFEIHRFCPEPVLANRII